MYSNSSPLLAYSMTKNKAFFVSIIYKFTTYPPNTKPHIAKWYLNVWYSSEYVSPFRLFQHQLFRLSYFSLGFLSLLFPQLEYEFLALPYRKFPSQAFFPSGNSQLALPWYSFPFSYLIFQFFDFLSLIKTFLWLNILWGHYF